MMLIKRFALLLLLSGCSRPELACERIEGRLEASKEFCQAMTLELAKERCHGDPGANAKEIGECVELYWETAMRACIPRTGADRLAWALSEFCE